MFEQQQQSDKHGKHDPQDYLAHDPLHFPADLGRLKKILLSAESKFVCFPSIEIDGIIIPDVCFHLNIWSKSSQLDITMFDGQILLYLEEGTLNLANYFAHGKKEKIDMTTRQFARIFHILGRMFNVSSLKVSDISHHLICNDESESSLAYAFINGIPFYSKNFGLKFGYHGLEKNFLLLHEEALNKLSIPIELLTPTCLDGLQHGQSTRIPLKVLIKFWKDKLYDEKTLCSAIEDCIDHILDSVLIEEQEQQQQQDEDDIQNWIETWNTYQLQFRTNGQQDLELLLKIFCLQCKISSHVVNESIDTKDILKYGAGDPTLQPFLDIYHESSPRYKFNLFQQKRRRMHPKTKDTHRFSPQEIRKKRIQEHNKRVKADREEAFERFRRIIATDQPS
jgi:hypothetical protein